MIELLTVIAIIAVLSGITFGVIRGVKQNAAVAQARGELAVLAQALEEYKRQYGDYPQTPTTPAQFYRALTGKLGPAGTQLDGRRFVTSGQFILNDADPANIDASTNFLVDPWGRGYEYVYFTRTKTGSDSVIRGYVLYSLGARDSDEVLPSRLEVVPAVTGSSGGATSTEASCAKNLYANP